MMEISSDKATNVNLMTVAIGDVQAQGLREGDRLGKTGRALESHVAAMTGQFVNTWMAFANSDQEFGAAKPGEMLNKTTKGIVNSGTPLPMASQEEQDRRLNELQRLSP